MIIPFLQLGSLWYSLQGWMIKAQTELDNKTLCDIWRKALRRRNVFCTGLLWDSKNKEWKHNIIICIKYARSFSLELHHSHQSYPDKVPSHQFTNQRKVSDCIAKYLGFNIVLGTWYHHKSSYVFCILDYIKINGNHSHLILDLINLLVFPSPEHSEVNHFVNKNISLESFQLVEIAEKISVFDKHKRSTWPCNCIQF